MIYLDHAATTPLDPRVLEAMLPILQETWGNPSSPHKKGREARSVIDKSRASIAAGLGVKPQEVIFVSSGSEANTLAIFGRCEYVAEKTGKVGSIVLLKTEHSCSIRATEKLAKRGWDIRLIDVDKVGKVNPKHIADALTDDTALVSVHWANNEVGVLQPIEDIATLCQEKSIPFHTDAVQAIGQLPMPHVRPDMMSIAGHKFYGPKGIGALIVKDTIKLIPQVLGGGQEFGLRAGTEDAANIVGMAKALEIALAEQREEVQRLTELRDFFIQELCTLPGVTLNGPTERLPNNVNVRCAGHNAEMLVVKLDMEGICAATGAACVSGSSEPSHVLEAMGRTSLEAEENLRFSLGRSTTKEDLQRTLSVLSTLVA